MAEFRNASLFVCNLQIGGMPPIGATSCGNCPLEDPVRDILEVI
jgi:hypothetical protein